MAATSTSSEYPCGRVSAHSRVGPMSFATSVGCIGTVALDTVLNDSDVGTLRE